MSFLAPLFLAGLLTVALPFWLHRLQTQSSDRKPFSSAMLLETTEQQIHVRKKLKYLVLLALRVALLLLIAFAFAKPLWTDPDTLPGPGPEGTHLVVVDTSASMGREGVFDRAIDMARAAIDQAPGGAMLQVVSAANGILLESELSADATSHKEVLDRLSPGTVNLEFGHMMAALDRLAESLPPPVTLHLVSDFQDSGMPVRFADLVSARIETLRPHVVRSETAANWSVQSMRRTANGIDVVINGEGADDAQATVTVELNGVGLGVRQVEAAGSAMLSFDNLQLVEGDNRIAVRIEAGDELAIDNSRFDVIENQPPAPIPLITFNQGGLPVTYLTAALQADPNGAYDVELAVIGDFDARTLPRYRWVIVDDIGTVPAEMEAELSAFVENGGNILAFAGQRTATTTRIPVTGNAVAAASLGVATNRFLSIGRVDSGHPALAATEGWYNVNLTQTIPIRVTTDDQVLVRLENDEAFMFERRIGQGRVLVVAGGLENEWNDLPIRPVFVSFIVEAARYLSGATDISRTFTAGASLPLTLVGGASGQVIDPDGETVLSLADTTRAQQVRLDKIGFYEVYTSQGNYLVAVNVDPRESDPAVASPEVLNRWAEAMGGQSSPQVTTTIAQDAKPVELWHLLLLILALVLMGESVLGNWHLAPRTSRQSA